MAIGRTFKEALQKALRSLEIKRFGLCGDGRETRVDKETLRRKLSVPNAERIFYLAQAFEDGMSIEEIFGLTKIDRWFLQNIAQVVAEQRKLGVLSDLHLRRAKKLGFSDRQLAHSSGENEEEIRARRKAAAVIPTYRLVDTCAAEFEAYTPYYYSTYGSENEMRPSAKRKIMILGGGPNRIGQGIEFDYCCVHAAFALRELGIETIMVNSNPETVSTDYDTSDKLYFEPLTHEDVLNIYEQEKPEGVIVQFGGQTPLNLAAGLKAAGVPIIGTAPESIELAEDRKLFAEMLDRLGLRQTPSGSAISEDEAVAIAERIGYPVLVRPSFVLGGRAMELVYHAEDLRRYMRERDRSQPAPSGPGRSLSRGRDRGGCRLHRRRRDRGHRRDHGTHRGSRDSQRRQRLRHPDLFAFPLDPATRSASATKAMAKELEVRGLMNVQFAVKDEKLYVLEVNPRASRTVPFVSKAIGVPLAKLAAKVMTGMTLRELGFTSEIVPTHYSVKEAVFPFLRFEGVNISLGPEMKSTGEVMGIDPDLGLAFAKSQLASHWPLPTAGNVFISVKDIDKPNVIALAREYAELGFGIIATSGTAAAPGRRRHRGDEGVQDRGRPAERSRPGQERADPVHHQHAERQNPAPGRSENPHRRPCPAHPDHDHGAGRVRQREGNSLAAKRWDDGEEPAGISRQPHLTKGRG